MNNDRLIKIDEMITILCLSRSSIYNFINEGRLPPPLKIGRASRWRLSLVLAAIDRMPVSDRAA